MSDINFIFCLFVNLPAKYIILRFKYYYSFNNCYKKLPGLDSGAVYW